MNRKLASDMIYEETKLNIFNQFDNYEDSINAADTFYLSDIVYELLEEFALDEVREHG